MLTIEEIMIESHAHAVAAGFHETPQPLGVQICLMHSELSEALEADRKHHGVDRVTEEFADAVIRICETCQARGWDLETAIRDKIEKNKKREYKHGGLEY